MGFCVPTVFHHTHICCGYRFRRYRYRLGRMYLCHTHVVRTLAIESTRTSARGIYSLANALKARFS